MRVLSLDEMSSVAGGLGLASFSLYPADGGGSYPGDSGGSYPGDSGLLGGGGTFGVPCVILDGEAPSNCTSDGSATNGSGSTTVQEVVVVAVMTGAGEMYGADLGKSALVEATELELIGEDAFLGAEAGSFFGPVGALIGIGAGAALGWLVYKTFSKH